MVGRPARIAGSEALIKRHHQDEQEGRAVRGKRGDCAMKIALLLLAAMGGCATNPHGSRTETARVEEIIDAARPLLAGPEADGFDYLKECVPQPDLAYLRGHRGAAASVIDGYLADGSTGAAWLAAWIRSESSLPLLRKALLEDRYFYGWEGPDYMTDESSYLRDDQYPHHRAFIAAIEAITGKPIREAVNLTDAEAAKLRAEASQARLPRGEGDIVTEPWAAKWLLMKLERDGRVAPPATTTSAGTKIELPGKAPD
jgi:hypothetical protein